MLVIIIISYVCFVKHAAVLKLEKSKGQGNFTTLTAPNARERCDRAGGGGGREYRKGGCSGA